MVTNCWSEFRLLILPTCLPSRSCLPTCLPKKGKPTVPGSQLHQVVGCALGEVESLTVEPSCEGQLLSFTPLPYLDQPQTGLPKSG